MERVIKGIGASAQGNGGTCVHMWSLGLWFSGMHGGGWVNDWT